MTLEPPRDANRFTEMEVFTRVVERGGLSAAARASNLTPSAVSKLLARLERRLGVRLLTRTTRKLQLTPEGAAFYERAARILDEVAAAEQEAAAGAAPRGRLRVNASVHFAMAHLLPLVPAFLAAHPQMSIEVTVTDRVVDLMEERADVALRVGPMRDSQLVARKIAKGRAMVVAAPAYIARAGMPQAPEDLARHNMLGFTFTRIVEGWPFLDGKGGIVSVPPRGNALVSNGEAMQVLALAGLGLARLAEFEVRPDVAAGRLVPVLEHLNPGDAIDVHAVYVGGSGPLSARIRAFVDFLAANVRM
ncbi:LysR family transcriptional regulator [Xanthobacter agilis]|jgi:DNA-binding transcriptional LysR family regulator|uniref:DNA-binding transcriptional LysR family regulator n=1 Tax=Xanthobacter agilis TaxID=47492 RepID=A0ABU0L8W7_XANAG|nr:LysR family transcriptional regulator [Xanthobacter agilis]MDQ0503579.1 DNA-binding transcriptional LysR family regulator [Xanthobacter agilis]